MNAARALSAIQPGSETPPEPDEALPATPPQRRFHPRKFPSCAHKQIPEALFTGTIMSKVTENNPILPGHHVRLASHPIVIAEKHPDGTPVVTVRRDGNIIREIQIRCSCGELIVLDCQYETN